MPSSRVRIVFMGTPEFAVPSLEKLVQDGYEVVCVVTQPDRPKGRGRKLKPPPVKEVALRYEIPVVQPERLSEKEFLNILVQKEPELIVVVAYGQILPKSILEIPKFGAINVHPSLLPKYRGAAPIQWTIMNDEPVTGVTIIKMTEKMDAGPILLQKEVSILPDETAGSLHDRLARLGADLLLEAIDKILSGSIKEVPQDETKATYAPKIDKSLSKIDWNRSAKDISAKIRALDPWPGAVSTVKDRELKLFSSSVIDSSYKGVPGRIYSVENEGVVIEGGEGLVLVREVQAPGRKRLKAKEFLKGFPLKEGDRFS